MLNNLDISQIPEPVRKKLAELEIFPDEVVDTRDTLQNFEESEFFKENYEEIEKTNFAGYTALACKDGPITDWVIDIGAWRLYTRIGG